MVVIIYGTGKYGRKLYSFLCSYGIQVTCFCETKVSGAEEIDGVPVIGVLDLQKRISAGTIIMIAVRNRNTSLQIKRRLTSIFLDTLKVVECNSFIQDNLEMVEETGYGGHCILCDADVAAWRGGCPDEAQNVRLFLEHHVIGGGYRATWQCPLCGGVDRERWLLWVLSRYTSIFWDKCCVLHFAPEPEVSLRIASNPDCDYYAGDIRPRKKMHNVDCTNIPFRDEMFDYIIANHVLEHITDVDLAMHELWRVLKPDGRLVLSFPICTDLKTLERTDINTAELRLKYYGQSDHVRLYGSDYLEQIEQYGWIITVYSPKDMCSLEEIMRYGFIPDDVMMVACKNVAKQLQILLDFDIIDIN